MPSVYVSGEQIWDVYTLGDASEAFIVLGSVLINYSGDDLLYILGREMGHIAAGHALWRTVSRFVSGQTAGRSMMGGGVMGLLNPVKLMESAIDAPLMAWSRHSEITADRAGLLVVGKVEVAHRVATQWTLKSMPIFNRLNRAAFDRQVAESGADANPFVEAATSAQPYLARRLRFQKEFVATPEFQGWRAVIEHWLAESSRSADAVLPAEAAAKPVAASAQPPADMVSFRCSSCAAPIHLPRARLPTGTGAKPILVRCAAPACRKVMQIDPQPAPPPPPAPAPLPPAPPPPGA